MSAVCSFLLLICEIWSGASKGIAMFRLSIARKLPLTIAALALLVGVGVGVAGYVIGSQTAQDLTFSRLDGLAADRTDLLRTYLASRELSVLTAARSETVQNALRDLHYGWMKLGDTQVSRSSTPM